uniref:Uncharacterized protein n=1 Tax=viral metagenome TaxID=1070528 RepID=A0A6M3KUB5_9ZZZZ
MKRDESRARVRRLAEIMYDMENGLFNYGDDYPSQNKDGTPKIVKAVALRAAGYTDQYAKKIRGHIWKDPYYVQQYHLVCNERKGSVVKAMLGDVGRIEKLGQISDTMLEILHARLTDPEEVSLIKTTDLLKYAPIIYRLNAEIEGRLHSQRPDKMAVVMMDIDNRLPKESRDKLLAMRDQYRAMRDGEVDSYAQTGDAQDEIIDVEAVEE